MGNVLFAMLRHVPHYVEELRGLADGAGIDLRDAFLLNTAPAYQPLRAAFAGATSGRQRGGRWEGWAAAPTSPSPRERRGRCWSRRWTGRADHRDPARLAEHYVFLRCEPAAGDDFLPYAMVSQPGRLWPELGMNAAGLGAGQSLRRRRCRASAATASRCSGSCARRWNGRARPARRWAAGRACRCPGRA